jgi:voltage-gated potassium channel
MIPVLLRLLRVARDPSSRLRVAVMLAAIVTYGTTGFMYFEVPARPDLGWSDGLWWALATITTVGYGDVAPQTAAGRLLVAVPLMVFGIGLLGYALSLAATSLVEARSREARGMAQLNARDHVLVINFPNVAKVRSIVDELHHPCSLGPDTAIVVIDEDLTELPPELVRPGLSFVRGNPARDETLTRAAADHAARAIVLAKRPGDPHSDDLALAVTLAIEARARRIFSVVECIDSASEELLRKAGADSIVCVARFDSSFLANELRSPGVQAVVGELLTSLRGPQLFLTAVSRDGSYADLERSCRVRGHVALGVRRGRELMLAVAPSFLVTAGDEVVTIGAAPFGSRLEGQAL